MAKTNKYNQKALSDELKRLAVQVVDVTDDGSPETRAQKLARAVWDRALGFKEMVEDKGGSREVVHPPETWAMQYVFERLEGKVPLSTPEESSRVKAADHVAELARQRINSLTKDVTKK